jgi:hypothetical protein
MLGQSGQNPPRRAGCCAGYLARHLAFFPEGVAFRPKGWYYTFTCTHAVLWADAPEIRVVWPKWAGRNGLFWPWGSTDGIRDTKLEMR